MKNQNRHVAKWWLVPLFDNALRRWIHNPQRIFGPYVREGMTVLDVGCGAGFNAVALARLVGRKGRVIAVDIQPKLLEMVTRRARRAGVSNRIETRLCEPDALCVTGPVDFVNAFWMVHETPDGEAFLRQLWNVLCSDGGLLFIAEPRGHVSVENFDALCRYASEIGFDLVERPSVRLSHAILLRRHCSASGGGGL